MDYKFVKDIWTKFAKHYPRLSLWIAKGNWVGLMLAGVAVQGAHEYAIALALLIAGAMSITFSSFYWNGITDFPRFTKVSRIFIFIFGLTLLPVSYLWIFNVKQDNSWSNLISHERLLSAQQVHKDTVGSTKDIKTEQPKTPIPATTIKKQLTIKKIPVVYKPFTPAYEIHKKKLGKPIEEVKLTKDASEAAHEYATIIWSNRLAKYYRLRNKDHSWSEYPQPVFDLDLKWLDNKWLTKRFHPTKGLKPPYSQLAALWDADEKNWSWIGFRNWHCYFDSIHYQKFEHGIIIGSFPKYPTTKNNDVLFILFDDSRWDLQESETLPSAKCIQAPDNDLPSVLDYQLEPSSTVTKVK
jgi:hypothetical protein